MRFEELGCSHDRERFDCGVDELNIFLKTLAYQNFKKGLSRTFVLIDDEMPTKIQGFFTLSLFEVTTDKLPRKYSKKYQGKAPAAKLARLAVSKEKQRRGLGKYMMIHAIKRVVVISEQTGIIGFFVDAKNESAKTYYEKFEFIPLPDHPLELFLPLATLQKLHQKVFGKQ